MSFNLLEASKFVDKTSGFQLFSIVYENLSNEELPGVAYVDLKGYPDWSDLRTTTRTPLTSSTSTLSPSRMVSSPGANSPLHSSPPIWTVPKGAIFVRAEPLRPTKDSWPVRIGALCALSAIVRITKKIPAVARETPITSGTETRKKEGVPGELNSTREPTIRDATPAVVKAPWVGALISHQEDQAKPVDRQHSQPVSCQCQADCAYETGDPAPRT